MAAWAGRLLAFALCWGCEMKVTQPANYSFDTLPDSAFIREAQLIPGAVPFSSATLWRKCKAGQFPKPVKLSERVTAWRVGDVRAWMNQCMKGGAVK